jgi:hypothetical protein
VLPDYYHPSQQKPSPPKLAEEMMDAIFLRAHEL